MPPPVEDPPITVEESGEVPEESPSGGRSHGNERLVYQVWEDVTELDWSESHRRGYTDGSAKTNLRLRDRLLAGEWPFSPRRNYRVATRKPSNGSPVTARIDNRI